MTQITFTVSLPLGTVKSRMPVMGTRKADRKSQGLALPSFVRVRSMTWPMMMFVMASMTLEMMGKIARKRPPQSGVRFSTSV